MKKQDLASRFAEIILQHLRSKKGRLTRISNKCQINRREFTTEGISRMRIYRLLVIFWAMELEMYNGEYELMTTELRNAFEDYITQLDTMSINR